MYCFFGVLCHGVHYGDFVVCFVWIVIVVDLGVFVQNDCVFVVEFDCIFFVDDVCFEVWVV